FLFPLARRAPTSALFPYTTLFRSLRSDGVLCGRPQEDGQFQFLVRVTDDQGRQTTKTLVLNVSPPAALTCVTQELPQLAVGEFFQTQLLAAGGKKRADGTYVWTHQSLLRL